VKYLLPATADRSLGLTGLPHYDVPVCASALDEFALRPLDLARDLLREMARLE
jgi:hypothetical protein